MIKCALLAVFVAALVIASPVPNGFFYYQASPYYTSPYRNAMLLQHRSQPLVASPYGVSAFASGNRVETGSYLRDAEVVKRKYNARLDSVQSVAEAYPNDDNEQNDSTNNREQTDLEYGNGSPLAEGPVADSPVSNVPQSVAQDVSVSSGQSPNPSIQLDEDDDDRYNSNRRPSTNDRSNTYFPITFGSTNGGAIAIANAFSNGKGGSALSRATAYGSPSKKRVQ